MADIREWLAQHGLERYAQAFADNDIELDILADITEDDLKDLGLSLGDRKRFMKAVTTPADSAPETAAPVQPQTGGERRQVTIMFADLSGFTSMSNGMDPEEVHALLNDYFAVVDGTVESYGGTIDKHIGDAVMALFGAPIAHSNDPERAVRASLEIHRKIAELTPPLKGHIGVASGQVVASRTGSDAFDEYTVTGASVNLASRLQDLANSGETLISDDVYMTTAALLNCHSMGEVEVKGIEKPVKVWRVDEIKDSGEDRSTEQNFVGRKQELAQLESVLNVAAETGSGQLVLIRGEPGIGKTRITDQLDIIATGNGYACHKGLVLDFGAGAGRDAIPNLIKSLLGVSGDADQATIQSAANAAFANKLLAPDLAVHLNDILDLPQPGDLKTIFDTLEADARVKGRDDTIAGLIIAAAKESPVMLRVEDVHWADGETLGQIANIARFVSDHPIVFILTTRIQGDPIDPVWKSSIQNCPLTTIELGPLRSEDALTLARDYLSANERLAKACIERAAGNPLFLDQLLRNAEEGSDSNVPASVQSIVQTRMDNLEAIDQEALQAAAILGQRFDPAALKFLIGQPNYAFAGLIENQLIKHEGAEFLFAHALVRDGIQGSLLREKRQRLHSKAAAWYKDKDLILYARHLERADDPSAPLAYHNAAKERAAHYRYERAIELVDIGLKLSDEPSVSFKLTCLKGEISRTLGNVDDSIGWFRQALDMAETPSEQSEAHIGLAAGMRIIDKIEDAFKELAAAEGLAKQAGDDAHLSEICHIRGNLYFPLGKPDECLIEHRSAHQHAIEADRTDLSIQALGGLGDANYAIGNIYSARDAFTECVKLAEEAGFGATEVANRPMIGYTSYLIGDFDLAMEVGNKAIEHAERVGHQRAKIIGLNAVGGFAYEIGDPELGKKSGNAIMETCRTLNARRFETFGLNVLAGADLVLGDLDAASSKFTKSLALAEEFAFNFTGPWTLGGLALAEPNRDRAYEYLNRGLAALKDGPVAHCHFFLRRDAMDVYLKWGDWDLAIDQAEQFEAYLGDEVTSWGRFYIDRARALAKWGSGNRNGAEKDDLQKLSDRADQMKMITPKKAITAALAEA